MPDLHRIVAGLSCGEVLDLLSDYVDGDLPPQTVARVRAHVEGCDHCERFGGTFGALVSRLRRESVAASEIPSDIRRNLAERMRTEWSPDREESDR
jgi:anti-sigma factor (TIGR02949 family)